MANFIDAPALTIFSIALLCIGFSVPGYAEEKASLLDVTTKSIAPNMFALEITVRDGWRFNEQAPIERRVRFLLDDREKNIEATEFSRRGDYARVTVQLDAHESGELEALLCQPERCKRVRVPVYGQFSENL